MDKLILWREKQLIKVVTGVRRCGKSTLLELYIDYLRASGVRDEQIISINLEKVEYEDLLNHRALYNYLKKRLCKNQYTYIFIDEVQQCTEFEKAVDSLFIKKKVDLHITGSNAHMLSGELATLLSGRYVEITMLPLSFGEYIDFTKAGKDGLKTAFNDYLKSGSFPYVAAMKMDDAMARTYVEGIYNTILIKDVANRKQINDISVLEDIIKFLCSNIGSPVSIKKISDTLNSGGRKISVNTVETYLRALCESFVFYKVSRYDIKGKQLLKTNGKYYIVDTGVRNLLLAGSSADLGHLLENIVYLELLRRGYRVNIGKIMENEVDFVAADARGITYIQVSATVLDENTLRRELEPLQKIQDNHPKYLLTLDDYNQTANYDGIRKMNIIDWLLSRSNARTLGSKLGDIPGYEL
ncbi:ATP-binding protein [Treponema primitia]|uniref:ATP-binding protein n=1 Tax=Treponema primitia TaxID=88058 RepID=UPI001E4005B1|nr:ATP-binding protein [Treponema primitia]